MRCRLTDLGRGIVLKAGVAKPLVIDWIERLAIGGAFAYLIFSRHDYLLDPEKQTWFVLYLISEGLVVIFVLTRRHTQDVTMRPRDWIIAVGATAMPLLAKPSGTDLPTVLALLGVYLVVIGIVVEVSAKLTLRRSFGLIAANRGVKEKGPYGIVRHPMYAGYLFSHAGLLLLSPTLFNMVVYAAAWTFQIARILIEEGLLGRDRTYQEYTEKVTYRLIPRVF